MKIAKEKSESIKEKSFSILKSVEDENHYLSVFQMCELIKNEKNCLKQENLIKENLLIYNRFLNKKDTKIEISDEYKIEVS